MTQLWRRFLFLSSAVSVLSASASAPFVSSQSSDSDSTNWNGPVGSCPYSPVYLNDFSLTVTPTGSDTPVDLRSYITPTYSPSGPEWRYVIERGEDIPTGTITFTPLSISDGATFRIRTNGADYSYANAGESITSDLTEGTDLLEFDVIQAPCQGTDIQEYSITLYQNGTSNIPPSAARGHASSCAGRR